MADAQTQTAQGMDPLTMLLLQLLGGGGQADPAQTLFQRLLSQYQGQQVLGAMAPPDTASQAVALEERNAGLRAKLAALGVGSADMQGRAWMNPASVRQLTDQAQATRGAEADAWRQYQQQHGNATYTPQRRPDSLSWMGDGNTPMHLRQAFANAMMQRGRDQRSDAELDAETEARNARVREKERPAGQKSQKWSGGLWDQVWEPDEDTR